MGLFDKIKNGMKRTREAFSGRMDELVETYKELDDDFYDDLTDILIMPLSRRRLLRLAARSGSFWRTYCFLLGS